MGPLSIRVGNGHGQPFEKYDWLVAAVELGRLIATNNSGESRFIGIVTTPCKCPLGAFVVLGMQLGVLEQSVPASVKIDPDQWFDALCDQHDKCQGITLSHETWTGTYQTVKADRNARELTAHRKRTTQINRLSPKTCTEWRPADKKIYEEMQRAVQAEHHGDPPPDEIQECLVSLSGKHIEPDRLKVRSHEVLYISPRSHKLRLGRIELASLPNSGKPNWQCLTDILALREATSRDAEPRIEAERGLWLSPKRSDRLNRSLKMMGATPGFCVLEGPAATAAADAHRIAGAHRLRVLPRDVPEKVLYRMREHIKQDLEKMHTKAVDNPGFPPGIEFIGAWISQAGGGS